MVGLTGLSIYPVNFFGGWVYMTICISWPMVVWQPLFWILSPPYAYGTCCELSLSGSELEPPWWQESEKHPCLQKGKIMNKWTIYMSWWVPAILFFKGDACFFVILLSHRDSTLNLLRGSKLCLLGTNPFVVPPSWLSLKRFHRKIRKQKLGLKFYLMIPKPELFRAFHHFWAGPQTATKMVAMKFAQMLEGHTFSTCFPWAWRFGWILPSIRCKWTRLRQEDSVASGFFRNLWDFLDDFCWSNSDFWGCIFFKCHLPISFFHLC